MELLCGYASSHGENGTAQYRLRQLRGGLAGDGHRQPDIFAHALLTEIQDVLAGFGGHRQAAGLSILPENLPLLIERFEAAARSALGPVAPQPSLKVDGELSFGEVGATLVRELSLLEPFGCGNPEPVFASPPVTVVSRREFGDNHVVLSVRDVEAGVTLRAKAWRMVTANILAAPLYDHIANRLSREAKGASATEAPSLSLWRTMAYNGCSGKSKRPTRGAWGDTLTEDIKAVAVSPDLLDQGLEYGDAIQIEGLPGQYKVLDLMFSGFDKATKRYDKKKWAFAKDDKGVPRRDPTLKDPRCVFQLLKTHYSRYTIDKVSSITGVSKDNLMTVWKAVAATGKPDKAATIMACDVDLIPIRLVHLDAVAQAKGFAPLVVSAWNRLSG